MSQFDWRNGGIGGARVELLVTVCLPIWTVRVSLILVRSLGPKSVALES